jgi:tRNA nucleotidyltransferase (CCA-adding enzyme)
MQAYRVGGSVRDELLGLPVVDRDWVVVGATPQEMIDRGFRPVGKDFPVFLQPDTHEEYALARTERKTGPGYKGFAVHFAPGVTLEEDLARRDLTINAIAQAEDGSIIDPFNGRQDLKDRVLRHVSESFAEDPVRILRVARFAARFTDFRVAPQTMALMQRMTAAGEVDALVAERVWQELARGLQEAKPSRMIEVLQAAGALRVLLPELGSPGAGDRSSPRWPDWLAALDRCAARKEPLPVSLAVLLARAKAVGEASGQASGQEADQAPGEEFAAAAAAESVVLAVSQRLRAPVECRDVAVVLARERQLLRAPGAPDPADVLDAVSRLDAPGLLQLLDRCDAWRRPGRVTALIHAAAALSGADPDEDIGAIRLQRALAAASRVDQGEIARRHQEHPEEIREAINRERTRLIAGMLASGAS